MATELLDLRHWLLEHGFREGLFRPDSWNAETDPYAVTAFIPPKNYEILAGTLKHPECHFVCAPPGGGKSSLLKAIKAQLDASHDPRILTVEYLVARYEEIADAGGHCRRIAVLVNRALQRVGKAAAPPFEAASGEEIVETLARHCREQGFDALYILVDHVSTVEEGSRGGEEQFKRISALVSSYSLLSMGLQGVVFKFFLPEEVAAKIDALYRNKLLRSLHIEWDRALLREILLQRLIVSCPDQDLKRSDFVLRTFEEMFDPAIAPQMVDILLDAGCRSHSPRAMWQLGYALLEEHFGHGGVLRHRDDLIGDGALQAALAGPAEEPAPAPVPPPAPKTVFISHTWAPQDIKFSDKLARALRRRGLDVWYDGTSLGAGDSLPDKIQQIIGRCDYAVVVLSPDYFSHSWTRRELDLLVDREIADRRNLVIPILHNISIEDARKANGHAGFRLALYSSMEFPGLVDQLVQAMKS